MGLNVQAIQRRVHDAVMISDKQLAFARKIKEAFELEDDVQHMTKQQAAAFITKYADEYRASQAEIGASSSFTLMKEASTETEKVY